MGSIKAVKLKNRYSIHFKVLVKRFALLSVTAPQFISSSRKILLVLNKNLYLDLNEEHCPRRMFLCGL
jgi:hypothetical protein